MVLELPSTVLPTWLVTLAAGYRPMGKPTDMRLLAAAHHDTQRYLIELADDLTEKERQVAGIMSGLTGPAAAAAIAQAAQGMRTLAEIEGSLGDQLLDGARDIEFEQLMVDVTVWFVALQIGYALMFPHGALVVFAARLWTQKTLQLRGLQSLALAISKGTQWVASRPVPGMLVQGGGYGAVQGVGTNLLAQSQQIRAEDRAEVDLGSAWVSTVSGAVGGIAGDAGARAVAPAVARLAAPVARVAGAPVGRAVFISALGAAGGLIGTVPGTAASVWAAGGSLDDLTADDWRDGLISGIGGGVIGAAGYAIRSSAPPPPKLAPVLRTPGTPTGPGTNPIATTSRSEPVPVVDSTEPDRASVCSAAPVAAADAVQVLPAATAAPQPDAVAATTFRPDRIAEDGPNAHSTLTESSMAAPAPDSRLLAAPDRSADPGAGSEPGPAVPFPGAPVQESGPAKPPASNHETPERFPNPQPATEKSRSAPHRRYRVCTCPSVGGTERRGRATIRVRNTAARRRYGVPHRCADSR